MNKFKALQKIMGCEVVEREILRGMNIAIKQGDKLFVWPGFVFPSEFKYIEVPTPDECIKQLQVECDRDLKERLFASSESKRIEYLFNRSLFIIS